MVAIQATTGAATAILLHTMASRYPVAKTSQSDAAVKAAIGLALLIASTFLTEKNGWGKQLLVAAGVGIASAGVLPILAQWR